MRFLTFLGAVTMVTIAAFCHQCHRSFSLVTLVTDTTLDRAIVTNVTSEFLRRLSPYPDPETW